MQANNVKSGAGYVVSVVVEGYTWFVAQERGEDGRYMLTNDISEAKRYQALSTARFTSKYYHGDILTMVEGVYRVSRERSIDRYIMMKRPDKRSGVAVIFTQRIGNYTCFNAVGDGYVVEFSSADPTKHIVLDRIDGVGNNYSDVYEFMCARFPNRVIIDEQLLCDLYNGEWEPDNQYDMMILTDDDFKDTFWYEGNPKIARRMLEESEGAQA